MMENFYNYTIENYTLSGEAQRILDGVVIWAGEHYEDKDGTLTDEGVHFIESVVADNIGMDRQEIIDNWR